VDVGSNLRSLLAIYGATAQEMIASLEAALATLEKERGMSDELSLGNARSLSYNAVANSFGSSVEILELW
jgi:hypothetical protein